MCSTITHVSLTSSLTSRIQVLLTPEERDTFRAEAARRGESLSAWMRGAAQERLARSRLVQPIQNVSELETFFETCDGIDEPGTEREPDWDEHLRVMNESRRRGLPGT